MSDRNRDLAKYYEENVLDEQHPRSIGLFTIPEYPEYEAERGMLSAALDVILTTLRYLAPATLLTLFWGQQSFLFRLLKHIDSAFRAIIFSSEEQKQAVIQWLDETGPVRVDSLETVWRHGWIVCGVLDMAMPGACAGHAPTRLPLNHAQAIADHYLGVEPVFSRQELESNDSLSKHQEWKLATYLDRIRQALTKLTPPVSKPTSQRTSPETTQFTLDYVARGSGLSAAQVNSKMNFKIYPTGQQSLDPGEITILIRGPKDTYGMTVLPPILGKAQLIRQKLLGLQNKQNYTENVLPITQGATYLRAYGKNDMNKTYHIPKTKYDIQIEEELLSDHAKISYIVNHGGRYEISITSRGQNIVGSPFTVTASNNIIGILERESFSLEDGEEIDIVDIKTDRKVVLRIVDFVTEKMLLKENGCLEKITDDEAKLLMTTENVVNSTLSLKKQTREILNRNETPLEVHIQRNRFQRAVRKIITIIRICKAFMNYLPKQQLLVTNKSISNLPRSQQDIPDIVNSTLNDTNIKPYCIADSRDKIIIPKNISVSILTEKQQRFMENIENTMSDDVKEHSLTDDTNSQDSLEEYGPVHNSINENLLVNIRNSLSNPFLNDVYEQNYKTEKKLGSFLTSEYERNNYQCEKTENTSIKVIGDDKNMETKINNPFLNTDLIELSRPKSPVFKIISGEINNRDDTGYLHSEPETTIGAEMLANEFINPFFIHKNFQINEHDESLPITDFIIGAPVSLPPVIRTSSPVPEMESLIITDNDATKKTEFNTTNDASPSVFSTPIHTNQITITDCNLSVTSTFHSLESENTSGSPISRNINQLEDYQIETSRISRNVTPKKDIWDSAYVSIDDNNSSPDSNNNDNTPLTEAVSTQKISPSDISYGLKHVELSTMGPAEREIWQTCSELKDDVIHEDNSIRPNRFELKRPIFTPIIEESDRSISSGIKDIQKTDMSCEHEHNETDTVTVAFAELNNLYKEYFPNTETDSTKKSNQSDKSQGKETNQTINTTHVDSASEIEADVKRHTKELEGKISEVHANVTESISVSQTLQENKIEHTHEFDIANENEIKFGERKHKNIVLEGKKYWDERIRQLEAKSEESTSHQKKRRLSSKHLRNNDSLTKRRGKQIIKNFLNADETIKHAISLKDKELETAKLDPCKSQNLVPTTETDTKLVDEWKKYWDNKLESDNVDDNVIYCFKTKSKTKQSSKLSIEDSNDQKNNQNHAKLSSPVKQELPEEVYKAFETSPKRFFGTSRKQILNKIDTFLGKPSTADKSSADVTGVSQDSGLVSSRISLFHKMSNTEDLSWSKRKSQSMHNIYQNKNNDKNTASLEKAPETIKAKTFEISDKQCIENLDGKLNVTNTDNISNNKLVKLSETDRKPKLAPSLWNKSFDESTISKESDEIKKQSSYVKKAVKHINKDAQQEYKYKKNSELRKTSISKSEMDIFNKTAHKTQDDDLDKYKSCDELPKINVKNFISLYESVSNTANLPASSTSNRKLSKVNIQGFQKQLHIANSTPENVNVIGPISSQHELYQEHSSYKSFESNDSADTKTSDSYELEPTNQDKETTYVSLSDIELEIIESPNKSVEPSPERDADSVKKDYKSRFKMAKEFFQSLEEIRDIKKPTKLNECQQMLQNKSSESPENKRPPKRIKKKIKSHSMPSSEIAKIWKEMQDNQVVNKESSSKLVKISEKFNVDDLFSDVMEGKLSRQGSLRGIPHKKAVLEAFRSMENISDRTISPYEMAVSDTSDVTNGNQSKCPKTYLSEYPYLPTTDPSKYRSRLDTKASGLITLKELLNKKPRRNSVPDLRLNASFTADL
ncbi:uncharacterized protein ACR2FA_006163 [Aphomia sociella]